MSATQSVAGVTFVLERNGHAFGYSGSHGGQTLNYEVGTHKIEFNNGELTGDGSDYGNVKAGDTVRLASDGTLFVNGNLTGPFPIKPKRVDPPTLPLSAGDASVVALTWAQSPARLIALTTDKKVRGWDVPKPEPVFTLSAAETAAPRWNRLPRSSSGSEREIQPGQVAQQPTEHSRVGLGLELHRDRPWHTVFGHVLQVCDRVVGPVRIARKRDGARVQPPAEHEPIGRHAQQPTEEPGRVHVDRVPARLVVVILRHGTYIDTFPRRG